jgi:hypothetical protein
MSPQRAYRLALIMIPLSIALGIVAVLIENWFVLVAMILNLVVQTISWRANRRRLRQANAKGPAH